MILPSKYPLTYKTLPCNPPLTPNAFPNALAFPKALTFHNTLDCFVCIPLAPAKAGLSHQLKDTDTPDSSQRNDEG